MNRSAVGNMVVIGALAGLVGGVAEVIWICIYATLTDTDAALVARAVTQAFEFGGQAPKSAVGGIGIHMALAAMLGIAIAFALRTTGRIRHGIGMYTFVIAVLAIVWAVNILVVLPIVSPQFVKVVPYGVSFLSKLFFGIAAAWFYQLADFAATPPDPGFASPHRERTGDVP